MVKYYMPTECLQLPVSVYFYYCKDWGIDRVLRHVAFDFWDSITDYDYLHIYIFINYTGTFHRFPFSCYVRIYCALSLYFRIPSADIKFKYVRNYDCLLTYISSNYTVCLIYQRMISALCDIAYFPQGLQVERLSKQCCYLGLVHDVQG